MFFLAPNTLTCFETQEVGKPALKKYRNSTDSKAILILLILIWRREYEVHIVHSNHHDGLARGYCVQCTVCIRGD